MEVRLSLCLKDNTSVSWACQELARVLTEIKGEGNYGFFIDSPEKTGEVYFDSYDPAEVNMIISRLRLISPQIEVTRLNALFV